MLPSALKLSFLIAGVIILTISATIAAFIYTSHAQRNLLATRLENRDVRIVQLALLDVETGARGYALSTRPEYIQP